MTNSRIHRVWLPVMIWCLSLTCLGQYKAPIDSLWTGFSDTETSSNKNKYVFDASSPLGRTAQVLHAKSYEGKSISITEKGLWIKLNNQLFKYRDQHIYRMDESKCALIEVSPAKADKRLRRTVKVLNKLYKKSAYARKIIQTLQESENKFTISIVNCIGSYMVVPIPNNRLGILNNNAYAFQVMERNQNIVDYAPFDQIGSGAEIRWGPKHKLIKLAHELSHAYDANYGLLDDRLVKVYGIVIPAREVRALYHENIIRTELGKKLREELKNGMRALVVDGIPHTIPLPVSARY